MKFTYTLQVGATRNRIPCTLDLSCEEAQCIVLLQSLNKPEYRIGWLAASRMPQNTRSAAPPDMSGLGAALAAAWLAPAIQNTDEG